MILVTTPGNVGHAATRLLAHDPARPQPFLFGYRRRPR